MSYCLVHQLLLNYTVSGSFFAIFFAHISGGSRIWRKGECVVYVMQLLRKRAYVTCSGKRYISTQKKKIELLATKESAKLALSNDSILALVSTSVFAT